ncbi:MAG: pilus assembly protein PilM [Planctomycetes bacterium]|nr:pilus assembly protein PilM [Planctomycetota bacterium]
MAKALGIDIGWHACKVAVVDGGPKGARLVRYAEVAYDAPQGQDPSEEVIVAALRRALSDAKGPKGAASFAVPAEQCILREITVPFDNDDQIAKVVKFEFEPHLHQGAIEDVVLDFVRTGPARAGSRVLCIAALKTLIRARLARLTAVGVDPLHLDVDVAALFNVAKQSGALEEHPNCLVIDIGARTTKAVAIRDGQLRVARSIRLGAKGADARLDAQFDGDRDAARRALETATGVESLAAPAAGSDGPSTVEIVASVHEVEAAVARAVQDDFLSRVLRETQRSLPATSTDKPLTRVFLTGGGARHPRARERIAAHFGVEVADLPVFAKIEHKLPPSDAARIATSGAVAIGTALKVMGVDDGDVDLRQEEFRFSRTFDRVKTALAIGSTLLFFGVFLAVLESHLKYTKVQLDAAQLKRTMVKELETDVFAAYSQVPKPRPRVGSADSDATMYFAQSKAYVKTIQGHLKNELGLATDVPPIRSCLEIWTAVTKGLQDARDKEKVEFLLVKDERYWQDRGDLTVVVGDLPDGDRIAKQLRLRKEIISDVEIGAPKATKDGKQEITLKMRFKEKTQETPGAAEAVK